MESAKIVGTGRRSNPAARGTRRCSRSRVRRSTNRAPEPCLHLPKNMGNARRTKRFSHFRVPWSASGNSELRLHLPTVPGNARRTKRFPHFGVQGSTDRASKLHLHLPTNIGKSSRQSKNRIVAIDEITSHAEAQNVEKQKRTEPAAKDSSGAQGRTKDTATKNTKLLADLLCPVEHQRSIDPRLHLPRNMGNTRKTRRFSRCSVQGSTKNPRTLPPRRTTPNKELKHEGCGRAPAAVQTPTKNQSMKAAEKHSRQDKAQRRIKA